MNHKAIVIEHQACWGCKTCEVACKQETQVPDGVKLIDVMEDGPKKVDGKLSFQFLVKLCRHCEDLPCADACPVEAIIKRNDGIVVLKEELCTGCKGCLDACPYQAIAFNEEREIAQKCNLCHHRIDNGLIPACADNVCLAHCIHFGAKLSG